MADFTCADAFSLTKLIPRRSPPRIVTGSVLPSVAAPIARSGPSTRSIGRLDSEASPVKVTSIGKPAAAPISSRAPVPLLPQSTGARRAPPLGTSHPPFADADALDLRTERPHGLRRVQDVVAFEQAADARFAARKAAEDQRTMRDGLVARHVRRLPRSASRQGAGQRRFRLEFGRHVHAASDLCAFRLASSSATTPAMSSACPSLRRGSQCVR